MVPTHWQSGGPITLASDKKNLQAAIDKVQRTGKGKPNTALTRSLKAELGKAGLDFDKKQLDVWAQQIHDGVKITVK